MRWVLAIACLLLLLVGAGCGDDDGSDAAGDTAAPELSEPDTREPGQVLLAFATAAGAGDADELWRLLTPDSQERLGGLEAFRSGVAVELQEGLGSLAEPELVLEEALSGDLAVATLRGRGTDGPAAYAAALWLEDAGWRISLGALPTITPLAPEPGTTVEAQPTFQVRFSTAELDEGAMWVDDAVVPSLDLEGDGTASGPAPAVPFDAGTHVVTAFGLTAGQANAIAWTFEVA